MLHVHVFGVLTNLQKKLRRVHMLDSDEEDEGEGGMASEPTARGGEPIGGTPTVGEEEELSNDNENFSHVSGYSVMCVHVNVLLVLFERRGECHKAGNFGEH